LWTSITVSTPQSRATPGAGGQQEEAAFRRNASEARLPVYRRGGAGREARDARKDPAAASKVGRVAKLSADGKLAFTLVSVDEETAAEREKLDAANDDVGLSLLIASQRLLMLAKGTPVRILEVQPAQSRCQVRILEGEHYGKTALVLLGDLAELA